MRYLLLKEIVHEDHMVRKCTLCNHTMSPCAGRCSRAHTGFTVKKHQSWPGNLPLLFVWQFDRGMHNR